MNDRKTSIQVTAGTLERLKALGRKGETYEEIVVRLVRLNALFPVIWKVVEGNDADFDKIGQLMILYEVEWKALAGREAKP